MRPPCVQVPGISSDMYFFTLGTSIAGGLVVGFVDRLEPQGGWVGGSRLTNAFDLSPCSE